LKKFAIALEQRSFVEGQVTLPDVVVNAVQSMPMTNLSQQTGYQIGDHNIPAVWKETQGEGITVAVLDTGCQMDHEDLNGRLINGYNFNGDTETINDTHGHGTHCAGIIAASNNDLGMVGVAPKAKVLVIQVLGRGGRGSMGDVAKGIDFAIEQGADIISMSLGSPSSSNAVHAAIKAAYKKGIPVICAAGNSGDIGRLDYPARYPETISIGALDENKDRTSWSQTGPALDFMAPGVEIYSTIIGNRYAKMSGSSMACPWAAGVVALMLSSLKKEWQAKYGTPYALSSTNVERIRIQLKKTAIDMDEVGKDIKTGWGLINPPKAVTAKIPKFSHLDSVRYETPRPAILVNSEYHYSSMFDLSVSSFEVELRRLFPSIIDDIKRTANRQHWVSRGLPICCDSVKIEGESIGHISYREIFRSGESYMIVGKDGLEWIED